LTVSFNNQTNANFEAKITTECVDNINNSWQQEDSESESRSNQQQKFNALTTNLEMDIAPNPFNNETNIRINLPAPSLISLAIYNLNGQVVEQIIAQEWQTKGMATITYLPKQRLNGMYYLVLKTNVGIQTRPIVIIE